MQFDPRTTGRVARVLLSAIPSAERRELALAMFAEAASLPPGPERHRWLLSSHLYAVQAGRATWARLTVAGISCLFILWIVYNAIDSGFTATAPEIASSIGLVLLLTATVTLLTPWALLRTARRRAPRT